MFRRLFHSVVPAAVMGVLMSSTAVVGQALRTQFAAQPDHAILLIVDGLSYKVWDRLSLPTLEALAAGGALVEKNYLPPAAHPHEGRYAELHTCSIPNPIMMSGTVFITERTGYLHEVLAGRGSTAFVANTMAYISLTRGYNHVYQAFGPDSSAVGAALGMLREHRPAFLRLHLQDTGGAGTRSQDTTSEVPWRGNIWAEDSPYRRSLAEADRLVGAFIRGLDEMGMLDRTVLLVMGDHGQADSGWHPLEIVDSSITSMILWGAGVKAGARIPYAEQVDVVPTLCALMGVDPPATSQGRVIVEALQQAAAYAPFRRSEFEEMLTQFVHYRRRTAEIAAALERLPEPIAGRYFTRFNGLRQQFYDIHRFVEWPRFQTVAELLGNNATTMAALDVLLAEVHAAE